MMRNIAGTLIVALAHAESLGRIKSMFDQYPEFNEDLLVAVFKETPTDDFLLTETQELVSELVLEFPTWLEKSEIGEPTNEGRHIELVQFKNQAADGVDKRNSAVLFDSAHHARELITIKQSLSILLKLLHGVHYDDLETMQML